MSVVVSLITTIVIKVWDWVRLTAPIAGKSIISAMDNLSYAMAARHSPSVLIVMLMGCVFGAICFPVMVIVSFSIYDFFKTRKSVSRNSQAKSANLSPLDQVVKEEKAKETNAEPKRKTKKRGKQLGFCVLVATLLIALQYILISTLYLQPSELLRKFENDITMIAPYVTESEILQMKSDWVCMNNKLDYDEIYAVIESVKLEHNLPD